MSNPFSLFRWFALPVVFLLLPASDTVAHAPAPTATAAGDAPLPGARLMAVGLDCFKKWNRVRGFFADPESDRHPELRSWVTWAQTLRRLPVRDRLAAIDARVDARIAYATDDVVWHRKDYWEDPLEVVRKGRTDCEGYVTLKMFLAAAAGTDREDMAIVVGRVPDLGIFHAVLIERAGATRYVLDNLATTDLGGSMDFDPIYAVDMAHAWSFPPWYRMRDAIQQLQAMKPADGATVH